MREGGSERSDSSCDWRVRMVVDDVFGEHISDLRSRTVFPYLQLLICEIIHQQSLFLQLLCLPLLLAEILEC